MNRNFALRSSALIALLVTGLAACSDDDDSNDTETNTESNMAAGGSDMGAAGSSMDAMEDDMGAGGSSMGDGGTGGMGMDTQEGGAMANGGIAGGAMGGAGMGASADATAEGFSFFVTSEGSTDGGNLGGLEGADQRCQDLADAAGAGDKTWQAYLSTDGADGENARDRIGTGPWMNFNGDVIATDLDNLFDPENIFNGEDNLILDENGELAPGNEHDIFTGSDATGVAVEGKNCENWTSDSAELTENPRVGHSDIPDNPMFSPSWNDAHDGQDCSQPGLTMRGGSGRLYCFAL